MTLDSCRIDKEYTVLSFFNAGSGGAFFGVAQNGPEDQPTGTVTLGKAYTAKIVPDHDNRLSVCNGERLVDKLNEFLEVEDLDADSKVVKFKKRKVKYLNVISKYKQFVGESKQRNVFSCVLILEGTKGDFTDLVFKKITIRTKMRTRGDCSAFSPG